MTTPLIKRFHDWLGVWRGPIEWSDGRRGIMEFTFESIFNGQAIEVRTVSFDSEGAPLTRGWGYLSLDRNGRVIDNIYFSDAGFSVLHEVADDPGMLSLHGPLPGNRNLDVAMMVEDDVLAISSRLGEGYAASDARPRTFTRMRRIGRSLAPREEAE
ncbi:MAG: hypothetical protein H6840_12285 [Planctomycetes bacterium]|nr:hypothetical protein [Planctomycetota bacterium]